MNHAELIIEQSRGYDHTCELADITCVKEGIFKSCPCWIFHDNSVLVDMDGGLFETHNNANEIKVKYL
jgi:hypothetical protein